MQILVDADAFPVIETVEKIAKEHCVPVTLLCDTNHAVDYELIRVCHKGDIVVSQDYGVTAIALGRGSYAIHHSGKWYTNKNID